MLTLRKNLSVLGLLFFTACGSGGTAEQQSVPIVPDRSGVELCEIEGPVTERVAELDLSSIDEYPCHIVAVPTGIELRPSPDGSRPDPDDEFAAVVMDARGRYYTPARHDPAVLVWDADGAFRHVIGSRGSGPGEFSSRPLTIFIGPSDTLLVRANRGRWHVFDPDHRFVRSFNGPSGYGPVHARNRVERADPDMGC